MADLQTEVLVIGGGPAGLAAAEAASSQRRHVTIIDENPHFGGQIWRAEKSALDENAKALVDSLDQNRVEMIASCACVTSLPSKEVLALSGGGTYSIGYEKLIIATGARERFIPFPGWTLPGVFGAGGLQALVKGGFDVSGKRTVVAGTGPLLLAVAAYLKRRGANVLIIAEQAPLRRLIGLGFASFRVPGKFSEARKLRSELRGIPYRTSTIVTKANRSEALESVTVSRGGKETEIQCDILAIGYHLVPNIEVAEMLGCAVVEGFVLVDEFRRTTIEDVFCAGEPTMIGGLDLALVEGRIAGLAAAGKLGEAAAQNKQRSRLERFAAAMKYAFRLDPSELRGIANDNVVVCRCEDVCYGKIKDFESFNEAKLQTRLGMGFCQGRVCGAACEALFGWETNTVRPPIIPVRVGELANLNTENT